MLVRPHDASLDDDEWRRLVATVEAGQLIAPGRGRDLPVVVPTHYAFATAPDEILVHFAKPNPVWAALAENPLALFCVDGPFAYVPGPWNANAGVDEAWGVPTSYYASAQLRCNATVVDDPAGLAAILRLLMARFQPEGGSHDVEPGDNPFGRLLPAIRGLRLRVESVNAKFKFGGNKSEAQRLGIADRLGRRLGPGDLAARADLLRRTPPRA